MGQTSKRECVPRKVAKSNSSSANPVTSVSVESESRQESYGRKCSLKQLLFDFVFVGINTSLVCDTVPDCPDGSDEKDCIQCPYGSCSHTCVVKKSSGAMKHNFTCECAAGYSHAQSGNRSYCHAQGTPAVMVLATENQLVRTSPSKPITEGIDTLMTDTDFHSKVESVDYIWNGNGGSISLFYTTSSRRSIQELVMAVQSEDSNNNSLEKLKNNEPKNVVTGLHDPRGIAVDWVAGRIYWLDSGHKTLSVSSLDGKQRYALISKGLVEPFDIVLDPESG